MSTTPRHSDPSTTTSRKPLSAPMLLVVTALDTTWRMFLPILGGLFAGIGLDNVAKFAPIGLIIGLLLGTVLSAVLVVRQLTKVRGA